jgi:hypothetical protein
MLDSDIGNMILPNVRFYDKEQLNNFKTEQENRPIYDMVTMVRIEIPGNQYSIIDTLAGEHHKRNYPKEWARYQNESTNDKISGTLLSDWSILRASQVKELNHYHFYTVEQVANSSDDQINKVTMIVGMGGHAFREKARQYLKVAKDSAVVEHQNEELQKRDAEIESLKQQMAQLMAMVQQPETERKKPGPKPKENSNEPANV